jgi:hypothetical protein
MYSEDAYCGLFLTIPGSGHVPQQGNPLSQTTVSPADLFLTQPSHGPTQSYAIPRNVASADYSLVGYPTPAVDNAPQGAPGSHPLVRVAQCMRHASSQFSVINDIPAGRFTGPPMPVRGISRGSSIGCEWILEDLSRCGQTITERTVPKHLAGHGIRSMHKDRVVQCRWRGCGAHIKRQSITRHAREVHLGSKRKSHNTRLHGTTNVTDAVF